MFRTLLKSNIHRAVVTAADLHYRGILSVDNDPLEASKIRGFELVQGISITNGGAPCC